MVSTGLAWSTGKKNSGKKNCAMYPAQIFQKYIGGAPFGNGKMWFTVHFTTLRKPETLNKRVLRTFDLLEVSEEVFNPEMIESLSEVLEELEQVGSNITAVVISILSYFFFTNISHHSLVVQESLNVVYLGCSRNVCS